MAVVMWLRTHMPSSPYKLRIGLGALLTLVACVAVVFAWYRVVEMPRAELIQDIEMAGGAVVYGVWSPITPFRGSRVSRVVLKQEQLDEIRADGLLSFPSLADLYIRDPANDESHGQWNAEGYLIVLRENIETYLASGTPQATAERVQYLGRPAPVDK